MDLGTCFVKYCLCLFNFVFVVLGTALLGFGIWLAVDQASIITLLKLADREGIKDIGTAPVIEQFGYALIALGAFIFIISFLGYCGSVKESRFLLGAYTFFLALIFVLEIVIVVLVFVYRSEAEIETKKVITFSIEKFYTGEKNPNAFSKALDFTMAQARCCGVNNYTDFLKAEKFQGNKTTGQVIPVACCRLEGDGLDFKPEDPSCIRFPTVKNSFYLRGCYETLYTSLMEKINFAIIVGVAVALLQILGIVFSICLYKSAYYDYK